MRLQVAVGSTASAKDLQFWNSVIEINDNQMERFVSRILKAMFRTLVDKKIAIFGFAFKPDTGDTRDAGESLSGTGVTVEHGYRWNIMETGATFLLSGSR